MKVVGLITEYNPFHKGHEYHIKRAKELANADYAIVIMSGNYVQRGTPAFMDKYSRATIALNHGADIVFELPAPFSFASAELFAKAAVTLLSKTGIVDSICFGCECDNLNSLKAIASLLDAANKDKNHSLNDYIKENMRTGLSYAAARSMAICSYFSSNKELTFDVNDIINKPNNILAIEYLKCLLSLDSNITPIPLQRVEATYHPNSDNKIMYSASSIRNTFETYKNFNTNINNDAEKTYETLLAFDKLYYDIFQKLYPIYEKDFNPILGEKLLFDRFIKSIDETNDTYTRYFGIDTDLSNRINKILDNSSITDWNDLISKIKTKNIAYTTISRALLSIILGVTKVEMNMYLSNDIASYLRILGFKKEASPLLKLIKDYGKITLIGQLTEINDNEALTVADKYMLNKTVYYDELYNNIIASKYNSVIPNEYKRKIIII